MKQSYQTIKIGSSTQDDADSRKNKVITTLLSCLFILTGLFFGTASFGQSTPSGIENAKHLASVPTFNSEYQTLSGTVKDSNGDPLVGANVFLKGTMTGVATDENGAFTFPVDVKPGDVIVFSFIGTERQEYTVQEGDSADITLSIVLEYTVLTGEVSVDEVYSTKPIRFKKLKNLFDRNK